LGFSIALSFQYKLNPEEYPDFFDSVQSRLLNKVRLSQKKSVESGLAFNSTEKIYPSALPSLDFARNITGQKCLYKPILHFLIIDPSFVVAV
jgi:hypothetical protein